MPTDDSRNPANRNFRRDDSGEDASSRSTSGAASASGSEHPPAAEDAVDFGSYVSSTVRSSSELFGTPARSAPHRHRSTQSRTSSSSTSATSARIPTSESSTDGDPATRPLAPAQERPNRYWRDSVGSTVADRPNEPVERESDDGGGGSFRNMVPWGFPGGDRPGKALIAAIALVLLAIVALIWFLNRGEDGGGATDPTPTRESVIDAVSSPAEVDDASATPAGIPPFVRDETPMPEPTEEVRRGGDNQLDQDDSESTPDISTTGDPLANIELGPVARQCPERCLVRIAGPENAEQLMSSAGTRPSFHGDAWLWVIATPEGIAYFEKHTETILVRDTADTLSLYMARIPDGESTDDRVRSFGTVLDSAGPWRLLQSGNVPANVKPLTDWGYQIDKVAPALPLEAVSNVESTSLGAIEIGALMDDVSSDNIERSIADLVGMGSTDGAGVGTRYYTSAANMQTAEYLFARLESYGLTVWYEDFLSWEGYLMVNVIGEIPGQDASAMYGVLAHFDSIADDSGVAPGADDNASGVAGSLEIARILSGYELHHPLRVVFVNVEEVGIVGSNEFAQRAVREGTPYEGVFNLDAIGAARQYGWLVLNGTEETRWMSDMFIRLNDAYGLNQAISSQFNAEIVADDNRLRENGIDSIMVSRELFEASPLHHTPGDTVDTVSIPGVVSCSRLTLLSLASLVQS